MQIQKKKAICLILGCTFLTLAVSASCFLLAYSLVESSVVAVAGIVLFIGGARLYHNQFGHNDLDRNPYATFLDEFLAGSAASLIAFAIGLGFLHREDYPSPLIDCLSTAWVGLMIGFFPISLDLIQQLKGLQILKSVPNHLAEFERLAQLDQHQEAEAKLCETIRTVETHFGSNHPETARLLSRLARYCASRNENLKANAVLGRSRKILEKTLGPDSPEVTDCALEMVKLDPDINPAQQIQLLENAVVSRERQFGSNSQPVSEVLALQAAAAAGVGDFVTSASLYSRAYQLTRKHLADSDPAQLKLAADYALVLLKTDLNESRIVANSAIDTYVKSSLPPDETKFILHYCAATAALERRETSTHRQHLRSAIQILVGQVGPAHRLAKEVCQSMIDTLYVEDSPSKQMFLAMLASDGMQVRKICDADPSLLQQTDETGWQILQWAIFLDVDRVLDTLLFANAPISGPEKTEWPPIHIGVRWGHRRALQTLLQKQASVSEPTPDGWTVLHRLAQAGDDRLVDQLVSKGAPIDVKNKNGDTPLQLAVRNGFARLVVELLANKANVLTKNEQSGLSVIHEAAKLGHAPVVECLVHNSAEVLTQLDPSGRTAEEIARQAGHVKLAQFLEHSKVLEDKANKSEVKTNKSAGGVSV
jgi:hypothetical protein